MTWYAWDVAHPTRALRGLACGLLLIAVSGPFGAGGQPPTQTQPAAQAVPSPGAGPIIVVETVKGTFEIETYPNEAPKTVARIVELVKKRFYNGLRVHRVEPGFVVQLGDPTTRDMTREADWGRMGSGTPIGVSEITKTRTHVRGAVAMAHAGDPSKADSQFYITLNPQPSLNGKYTVFGRVITGMDVVIRLAVTDRIIRVTVREVT
jgi:cyclophilin family peptidyl-prolyl cis-trans isomerase